MKAQLTQEAKNALIEALKKEQDNYEEGGECFDTIKDAISIVESFPTSSSEGVSVSDGGKPNASANWIPCSERLPEKNKVVLVSANDGEVWLSENDGEFGWHVESTGQLVTHWKPLPKPPTE